MKTEKTIETQGELTGRGKREYPGVKTCKHCNISFEITDKDMEFYEKISPVFGGKKYSIPTPTLCPDCRRQRILALRNERNLYKRQAHNSGKDIISIYSPDKPYIVLEQDFRWSDFDAGKIFLDFDFSLSAFQNFEKLLKLVPKRALIKGTTIENTDYGNGIGGCKDCYLIFATSEAQNCYFSQGANFSRDCADCLDLMNCEGCYQLVDGNNCYQVVYSQKMRDCKNCWYSYNCANCENCFACEHLSHKKFHIFNEPVPENEYFQKIEELKKSQYKEQIFKFHQSFPKQSLNNLGGENVVGDLIKNSKDVYMSFDVQNCENVRYSCHVYGNGENIMDTFTGLNGSSNLLESGVINKTSNTVIFSNDCWSHCQNIIYCTECKTCTHCFLCTGLVSKSYCILNKQYTKEEYEKLVTQIIEHMMKPHETSPNRGGAEGGGVEWGEFFPSSISPFGYNETVAMEYYPLTREEVLSNSPHSSSHPPHGGGTGGSFLHGPIFNWSDYETPFPKVDKIIPASKLPPNITDIPDDILNWAIECEDTKKPFRIIKQELEFYRKHNLPIPRKHPDQRHKLRMQQRNPRKLFNRTCDKCHKDIQTTYSSERPEIVYCEECYNKEIY